MESVCSRPGCKQEGAIGKLQAHIDNIKTRQTKLEELITLTKDSINELEKTHMTVGEDHRILLTKMCSFSQTQNTQLKDLINKYETLKSQFELIDKQTDTLILVTDNLKEHDLSETTSLQALKDTIANVCKEKIDPLDKWKTQIMTAAVVIPAVLTLLINLIVFHDKIAKLFVSN